MEQYISKDALVAEIESKRKYAQTLGDNAINSSMQQFYDGVKQGCINILSFLDTLEVKDDRFFGKVLKMVDDEIVRLEKLKVKEVDLDKYVTHYLLYEHHSPLNEIMHQADLKSEMQYHKDIGNAFKAGFELGMSVSIKAQKGKEVDLDDKDEWKNTGGFGSTWDPDSPDYYPD